MSDFISRNKSDWQELEKLLARGRKAIGKMTPGELARLDVLYRRVTIHLAQVATRSRDARHDGRGKAGEVSAPSR